MSKHAHALVRNCAPAFAGGDSHFLAAHKIAATCLVAERVKSVSRRRWLALPVSAVALWFAGASIVFAEEKTMSLAITSTAFAPNAAIPSLYTCEGKDISPPLAWSGAPAGTKSLALIVDDPDAPDPAAPKMTWVHWVLYNVPSAAGGLPEAIRSTALPAGTREGVNDWGRTGYGGPCPPIGRHRYFHKIYALDIVLPELRRADKAALEQAMQGHILAQAVLIGTYQKRQ
jgi:Raf kinase inhibitor-like YbhB/YbcL family protein